MRLRVGLKSSCFRASGSRVRGVGFENLNLNNKRIPKTLGFILRSATACYMEALPQVSRGVALLTYPGKEAESPQPGACA